MKYTIVLMLTFLATFGYSQDTTASKVDTTKISLGNTQIFILSKDEEDNRESTKQTTESQDTSDSSKKIKKKSNNRKSMWSGLQLGIATFDQQESVPDPLWEQNVSRSRHFAYNFYSRRLDLGTPYVGISSGIAVEFNRYALLNQNVRISHNSVNTWATLDTVNQLTKSYLKTTYLTIPLLLEFNTKRNADDGFRLALGLEAGYLLSAKSKVQYEHDGQRQVDKTKGNFNFEPFRFSPTIILGYKHLSAYAKANLDPAFKTGKGPKVGTGAIGLMWNFH